MSCNYNNCTEVTGNFYAGATFVTLSNPSLFIGRAGPIYFYNANACPAPNCCNPDASGTVLGTPTATGVSLTAGLAAPVQTSWKACFTLSNYQCSNTCGPCFSSQPGQNQPPGGECPQGKSSWECCPVTTNCGTNNGKVFKLIAYGCDANCYDDTLVVNTNNVTTRAATQAEINYQKIFWPPNAATYGTTCQPTQIILLDGVPWWLANHNLRSTNCANGAPRGKIHYAGAPWGVKVCSGTGSQKPSTVTAACSHYCVKEITAQHNCTTKVTTHTQTSQGCHPAGSLPTPSTFGVSQYNWFYPTANCGNLVGGHKVLEYKIALIDGVCNYNTTTAGCACGPLQATVPSLFANFQAKHSGSCSCSPTSSNTNPPPPSNSSVGAFCHSSICLVGTQAAATALGETWLGAGTTCNPNPCLGSGGGGGGGGGGGWTGTNPNNPQNPHPIHKVGACCLTVSSQTVCVQTTHVACNALGGLFRGWFTTCRNWNQCPSSRSADPVVLTRCFKAITNHNADLKNQPHWGANWRDHWIQVPCCPSRKSSPSGSPSPKPCCTSDCLSSTQALWANPSKTLSTAWRPSRTYSCGNTVVVQNINHPWVLGFTAVNCPEENVNDPNNWMFAHNKSIKYFIPYTRQDNTSSSWIMLSPGNSSVSYTPIRFLNHADTIKIFDASHHSYAIVKNSSSGFAFKPSTCAVVFNPVAYGQQVFKHKYLGYVGGSVPCLRCLDSTSYSSLPSIRASICVGPARIPEDFIAKGAKCNVATNINQMKEFSLEIPNRTGYARPPNIATLYKAHTQCDLSGATTTHPKNMPYMWLNCGLTDDGGYRNAIDALFAWPNIFTLGHQILMTTNMWCRGEYADYCCNGSLQSLGNASGCCDTNAYAHRGPWGQGCMMDITALNDPKVEYEWHFARDEAHDNTLRTTNYPASAAAAWTAAAAPYHKRSGEIDLSVYDWNVNSLNRGAWVNQQKHEIFRWEDGDCLPGRIVNLRARIKATCPLTGSQVVQPLWSYNRVAWAGGPLGNVWHKVSPDVHFHLGTRQPLKAPYKVAEQWVNRTYLNDTVQTIRFSPSCSVDCTSSSGQKGLMIHGTLCSGTYVGSSVKAYLPIGTFPHKGLSYKRWKQKFCHKLAFGNNGVPGFKTKTVEIQRTVNGSLRNDCMKIEGCEDIAPICPPFPAIGAPFNQSFGVIISGPYMGPSPAWGGACGVCIAITNCPNCCEPCDNGGWKTLGYNNLMDCQRAYGCGVGNPCYNNNCINDTTDEENPAP
jgi:hypothetical protein